MYLRDTLETKTKQLKVEQLEFQMPVGFLIWVNEFIIIVTEVGNADLKHGSYKRESNELGVFAGVGRGIVLEFELRASMHARQVLCQVSHALTPFLL
jgi:hypothetical protein